MRTTWIKFVFFICLRTLIISDPVVYPGPGGNVKPSTLYEVFVSQGGSIPLTCFTYLMNNDEREKEAYAGPPNRSVSFTSFAFEPNLGPVTVSVHSKISFSSCVLRPLSYGLHCHIINSSMIQFEISNTMKQVSVELDAKNPVKDALLIFSDPLENPSDIPNPNDPSVLHFSQGEHNLNGCLKLNESINHIYLAPGAYVHGGFTGTAAHQIKVNGRGLFSGEKYKFHDSRFPWSLITMPPENPGGPQAVGGNMHVIHDIIIVDPPKYYFRTYATKMSIRNVKFAVAWTYNTDGFVTGPNTTIKDSFVRSNDDTFKLYSNGMLIERIVIWQLENGGVTQTGWWKTCKRENIVVKEIDIIHSEWFGPHDKHNSQNNAIIDHALTNGQNQTVGINNITFSHIRYEDSMCLSLINVKLSGKGFYTNVILQDIHVSGWCLRNAIESHGITMTGIKFNNVYINGKCISEPTSANITITNAKVSFNCPSTHTKTS